MSSCEKGRDINYLHGSQFTVQCMDEVLPFLFSIAFSFACALLYIYTQIILLYVWTNTIWHVPQRPFLCNERVCICRLHCTKLIRVYIIICFFLVSSELLVFLLLSFGCLGFVIMCCVINYYVSVLIAPAGTACYWSKWAATRRAGGLLYYHYVY